MDTTTLGGELMYPRLVHSTGPCHVPENHTSVRRLSTPCQNTSCWELSGVIVALGADASVPRVEKSAGPFQ